MLRRSRISTTIIVLLILILLASGCAGKPTAVPPTAKPADVTQPTAVPPTKAPPTPTIEPTKAGPVKGGTLVVGRPSDVITLNPNDILDSESMFTGVLIFDNLVRFKPGTMDVEPWLAKSWEVLDNGLRWRFNLREGVKFHDGTPFNADAVVFTFMRMIDKSHPYYKYGKWLNAPAIFGPVKELKAVDEKTVDFIMKNAYSAFLSALASGSDGSIVSPTAVKKDPENSFKQPVGTGPFQFVEWKKDERIVLKRNESYWEQVPYADQVILRVIPENSARVLALQKGEINIMYGVDAAVIKAIKSDPNLLLNEQTGILHSYLTPNHLKKPWDNAKVRQALYHAINRKALVDAFWPGGTLAKGLMAPVLLGFNDKLQWPEYSPEKAKQLLTEAGFPNGFKAELLVNNAPRAHTPEPVKAAEAIQADLAKVGIQVQINALETATYLAKVKAAEHDLVLAGFAPLLADPWTIMYTQLDSRRTLLGSANNFSFYRNAEVDALNDQADRAADPKERAKIYEKLQEIALRDAVRVDIADINVMTGLRKEVQGFAACPIGYQYLQYTWLKKG